MSHRRKLEQVLDLLINEEQEKAEELLHQIMVEKARSAYDALMEDEDEDLGSEDFRADFADEIEASHDEIDSDEEGHSDDEDHDDDDDEELEDRVDDLETELEELQAAFDELVLGIEDEAADDDLADDDLADDDFADDDLADDDDDSEEFEFSLDDEEKAIEEATKLQHAVSALSNQEGKLVGTGKHSKEGATGKEAPYTHAPKRTETEGEEVDFAGGDEKGAKADQGKDHTPSSNVDVDHKDTGHHADKQKDGKAKAGTGDKSAHGEVGKESALGGSKSPRGA